MQHNSEDAGKIDAKSLVERGVRLFYDTDTLPAGPRALRGAGLLTMTVAAPYFLSQAVALRPAVLVPGTWIDDRIGFSEMWVPVYLSLYLLMAVPILAGRSRVFLLSALFASAVTHMVFLAYPTRILRPDPAGCGMLYQLIQFCDRPTNAFPSLHASLGVLAALSLQGFGISRQRSFFVWLWYFAILYSTLAVKQHVFWDLFGGTTLGILCYLCSERLLAKTNTGPVLTNA